MKLRTLLLACGASLALAGVASAQSSFPGPMPGHMLRGYPALPPGRIAAIVRASGLDPLFRPLRQGDTYVLRALDRGDVEYRLVIDAYTGRTMSVRATGAHGPPGPVYSRVFGPRDDRYDDRHGAPRPLLPPHGVPHARPLPPDTQPGANTATQAATPAAGSTTQAPLPRPRPYVMEATSSIPADPPKSNEPQKTPPAPPAPPAASTAPVAATAPPQNNGGASMPPVTPLD